MKVGKFVVAILGEIRRSKIDINPQDVESFVRKVFQIQSGETPSDYEFRLVSGSDIRKYYLVTNSESETGGLGGSCMRYANTQEYVKFYEDWCKDSVKLLIYVNPITDKIVGRSLVWKTSKETYMDRIYVTDNKYSDLFISWGKKNNVDYFYEKREYDKIKGSIFCEGWRENTKMPYMDTFKYGYVDRSGMWLSITTSIS